MGIVSGKNGVADGDSGGAGGEGKVGVLGGDAANGDEGARIGMTDPANQFRTGCIHIWFGGAGEDSPDGEVVGVVALDAQVTHDDVGLGHVVLLHVVDARRRLGAVAALELRRRRNQQSKQP